ncbi:60S ribosomal protein L10A [Mucor velutinosus]|uniref:60S ribosomal protein L10A n=1 Tax=Mucor velutinosus TaxID=708070 RepID=A0AAN7DNV2_9FUNG|nr:60S ribosomal protein L10A [Mucor velutinosus]
MVLLKWGWVQQRITFKFRPAVWKRRYLVLTTMSIHVHKSEKGVISSLFHENMPEIHVWSNFKSVDSYKKQKRLSKYAFMIETRDHHLYASLRFKCATAEERDKWITAIDEQLKLTSKMWSSRPAIKETDDNGFCRLTKLKQQNPKCNLQNPIAPVSVLDKWLEQLNFMDSPEKQSAAIRDYRQGSSCSETPHSRRGSHKRSSVQAGAVEKNEQRPSSGMNKKRMQKIIANY